jgi:hypothetical protein
MSYEWIDEIISGWATDLRLTVYGEYKDVEVRSTDVVSSSGAKCQIWIDPPDADDRVGVHVWNYKEKRADSYVPISQLRDALKSAYGTALAWVS